MQTLAALNLIIRQSMHGTDDYLKEIDPRNYNKFLVISIGTGELVAPTFLAENVAKWSVYNWLTKSGNPLIGAFQKGSDSMVDIHLDTLFKALNCSRNYLRIQVRK